MKKIKSSNLASRASSRGVPKTVDEYLAHIPKPARSTLQKVRATIRSAAPPGATETISYGIPALRYNGVLVWFAAFSKHCSLFPTASVIAKFKNELKGYTISKGTIRFATDKPLPAPLIKKMLKARVAEIKGKKPR